MAVLTADDLLLGPRGRGLCKAVAHRLGDDSRSPWPQAAWFPTTSAERGKLLGALANVDAAGVAAWRDPLTFLEPMEESVSSAMYWQPPDEEDVVLADPAVVAALRPVAEMVAAAPAAAWWSLPVDLSALRYTSLFDDDEALAPPVLTGAAERLSRWRDRTVADEAEAAAHRPSDAAAPLSGAWWATPTMTSLVHTTRPLPGPGSTMLAWQEDSTDRPNAALWSLVTSGTPRVWEIDRPERWTRLVERYPLEVTHTRRHDWYRTTGRVGAWYIPDWKAVAADWDAVHLSVAGYLTTATRGLPLADGESATVLAGWDPDQTWWLTDALATTSSQPEFWRRIEDADGPDFAWRWVTC